MKKLYLTTAAILLAVPAAFATSDVEAVTVIKTENGPVRIPASQFNAAEHTLHVADEHHDEHGVSRNDQGNNSAPQASAPVDGAPVAPIATDATAPAKQYGVLQNRGRFYIVDPLNNGAPVTDVTAVDPKGYPSNAEAWAVLVSLQTPSAPS